MSMKLFLEVVAIIIASLCLTLVGYCFGTNFELGLLGVSILSILLKP